MPRPLFFGANHPTRTMRGNDGLFEFERVPLRYRFTYCLAIFRNTENFKRCLAMIGKVAVQIAPAIVLRRISAHDRIAPVRHGRAIHLEIGTAAQRSGRLARVDCDLLTPSGPDFPEIGHRQTNCSESCRARLTDTEWRSQYWIAAASDVHFDNSIEDQPAIPKIAGNAVLIKVGVIKFTRHEPDHKAQRVSAHNRGVGLRDSHQTPASLTGAEREGM